MATTSKLRHTQHQSFDGTAVGATVADVATVVPHHPPIQHELHETPDNEDAAVRLPRRAIRRTFTPSSQSLPSSIALSPSAAPRKKKNKRNTVVYHSTAAPSAIASASRISGAAPESDTDEDVPLGKLIFSGLHPATPAATRASGLAGDSHLSTGKTAGTATRREEVKYDFCDLSSPHHIKEIRPSDEVHTRASKKRRASDKSSATKAPVDAPVPPPNAAQPASGGKRTKAAAETTPATLSKADAAAAQRNARSAQLRGGKAKPTESIKVVEDCRVDVDDGCPPLAAELTDSTHETPTFHSGDASKVRMPTPSLMRPSMGRCSVRSRGATVLDASDQDAAALKALLENGVGEENLEDFLKSATRLGKRVREAKRQREESVLRASPADLADLARCATELFCLCASERDTRRSKFFRVFGARASRLKEKCSAVNHSIERVASDQLALQQELSDLIEAVAHDQQKWDAVEDRDLRAAVASIKDKLQLH